jgi:hypothetical protein
MVPPLKASTNPFEPIYPPKPNNNPFTQNAVPAATSGPAKSDHNPFRKGDSITSPIAPSLPSKSDPNFFDSLIEQPHPAGLPAPMKPDGRQAKPNRMPDEGMEALDRMRGKTHSILNGEKLMSPAVQETIRAFDAKTPANIKRVLNRDVERSMIMHQSGEGVFSPGPVLRGRPTSVKIPPDIEKDSAKVFAHSHPYNPNTLSSIPSIRDHMIARANPDLEHIVQIPAPDANSPKRYIILSGAIPPRHYLLVKNPHNQSVRPPSPDGMTPYHHSPE